MVFLEVPQITGTLLRYSQAIFQSFLVCYPNSLHIVYYHWLYLLSMHHLQRCNQLQNLCNFDVTRCFAFSKLLIIPRYTISFGWVVVLGFFSNMERRQKEYEIRMKLLSRFSEKQLEQLRQRYRHRFFIDFMFLNAFGPPPKEEILRIFANNLTLNEIINEAKRHGIEYEDLLEELDSERPQKSGSRSAVTDLILRKLDHFKLTKAVSSEKELRDQLYQFLSGVFSERTDVRISIERNISGGRGDIVLRQDNKKPIIIELRIARSKDALQNLIGRAKEYKVRNPSAEIIVVILDVGYNVELDLYTKLLKEEGVKVKVLPGHLRRKKTGKGKTITIIEIG